MLKNIDMPRGHLDGQEHFMLPHAHDEVEANRRRELHGMHKDLVALEGQARGIGVAIPTIEGAETEEDLDFISEWVAWSGVNSGFYTAARDAEEMRKAWKFPDLVPAFANHRPSGGDLLRRAVRGLILGQEMAEELVDIVGKPDMEPAADLLRMHFGQVIGNACLTLECRALADTIRNEMPHLSHNQVTRLARRRSMETMHQSRVSAERAGVPASFHQLGQLDSPEAVAIRSGAPAGAFRSFTNAQHKLLRDLPR